MLSVEIIGGLGESQEIFATGNFLLILGGNIIQKDFVRPSEKSNRSRDNSNKSFVNRH